MNGLPGPYMYVTRSSSLRMLTFRPSKNFLESLGNDGLNKLLYPYEDKSAEAVCTFAFSSGPTMDPLIFQGRLKVFCA